MCQTKELSATENGQKGSDIRLEMRNDLSSRVRAKGLNMDEAISETKFGLFNYILILTSGMMISAMLIEKIGITFVFPVSHCDLNLTTSQKGILGAAGFFGIICSSHLWGFLADTKGRRCVIQPTLLIASCMSITSSLVQNFYLLAALRFLNGFFISASSATVYVYLCEFHNSKLRGRAMMGAQITSGVICMMLPLVAYYVINQEWQFDIPLIGITYKPWRLFLVLCSFPALTTFVLLIFLPESPKFVLGQGKQSEAFEILQKINRVNNGKNAVLPPFEIYEEPESIHNRQRLLDSKQSQFPLLTCIWNQTAPLFKPPHLLPTILICIIQFSIFYTSQGLNVFYADILNKMGLKSDDERMMMCDIINMKPTLPNGTIDGIIFGDVCNTKIQTTTLEQGIILQALYTGGAIIITLVIDVIPKFPIIFSILAGTGACGIAIMMTDIPFVQIGLLTILMSSGIGSNVLNTATVELYPTALRAMAISISLMFGRIGSITGSNTAAFLLENYCMTAFYLSGAILIAAGALTFFIPKIHERVSKSGKPK